MILRTTAQTSGSRAICASVARVSALIGLNATLPSSLTQISWRMPCCDRAAQAGFDQRFGDGAAALGPGAIGLAQRNAVAFGVADHAGFGDLGSQIDDANRARAAGRWTAAMTPPGSTRFEDAGIARPGNTTTECRSAC